MSPSERRDTADLVALILAILVVVVVMLTAVVLLWIEIVHPEQDTGDAADFVGRVVATLIAALVGYMAGRSTTPGGA